jgi:hypothetical protein
MKIQSFRQENNNPLPREGDSKMKNVVIAVLFVLFGLFTNACTTVEGDKGDTYNNITPNDGDTTEVQTGALYHFTASSAMNKTAWLQIHDIEKDNWTSEIITVTAETMYRYMEPGEYQVWIYSVYGDFDWYGHFTVKENVVTDIFAEIHEYTLVNINMTASVNSPVGQSTVGSATPVLDFDLTHDYSQAISISDLGFTLHANPTVIITSATLWVMGENGWEKVATSDNFGDNYFYLEIGKFFPIYPGLTQFRLTANILGANPGNVLQAEMIVAGYTQDPFTRANFLSFAIGNIIQF